MVSFKSVIFGYPPLKLSVGVLAPVSLKEK